MFKNTNRVTLCQNSVFAKLSGCQKWGFRKENCIFVFVFDVGDRETEKRKKTKWKKARNPIKIVFLKVVIQKWKMDIYQNLPDTSCVRKGEKTRMFMHTICFGPKYFLGPKQWKPGSSIRIGVSAEIVQNQKWNLFVGKGVFWRGWQSGFY